MSSQPNILLLFTDMQRADTIRALGNETIHTPHLDRLVTEGTSFMNNFSPCPVCIPARCSMHYGLYPTKTGTYENAPMMDDNNASYPALLASKGYRTHAIGKTHFSPDYFAHRGFQSKTTQIEAEPNPENDDYAKWLQDEGLDVYEPHGARGEMYYVPQISPYSEDAHPTGWVGNRSIDFIKEASQAEQPWCLYSGYIHPHPPFNPPKPWHKLYRAKDMPFPYIPEDSEAFHTWVNRLQNRYKYRDQGIDLNFVRTIIAYYYATISFIDFQVGKILECLEATKQLDNTLIMFSSDHGEYLGDYGCFGKRAMHDVSARVPMIVRYPERFKANHRCHTATSLCDVLPTFASAAGVDGSSYYSDGVDLAKVGNEADSQRVVYSIYEQGPKGIHMAVNKDAKYVYSVSDKKEFFFDRNTDPKEVHNLASKNEPRQEALKQDLLHHFKDNGLSDVYEEKENILDWKDQPSIDESYLNDPNAKLLKQDFPHYRFDVKGYTPSSSDDENNSLDIFTFKK